MLELSPINLERLTEMRAFLESYDGTLESWISNISKTFLKAMREVDGKETKYHLHCLRHTFAVRRLIQGASIYELKLLMGHSSVTTTKVYSNMNLKRVAQDFPTIVTSYVNDAKIGNLYTDSLYTTVIPTTYMS